jgi:hypothetical protein
VNLLGRQDEKLMLSWYYSFKSDMSHVDTLYLLLFI